MSALNKVKAKTKQIEFKLQIYILNFILNQLLPLPSLRNKNSLISNN